MTSRTLAAVSGLVGLLSSTGMVAAGFPLTNAPSPLAVCQNTIRAAATRLTRDAARAVSACLTGAIECVVDPNGATQGCCALAAERCHEDLAGVDSAIAQFEQYVRNRRCSVVPFADVVGENGLGYGGLANACGALAPPTSIDDLDGLSGCLARLIVGRTACFVGTCALPRGVDALSCGDLETELTAATGSDLRTCDAGACSPPSGTATPVPSPSATPAAQLCRMGDQIVVAASVDKPYAGGLMDLTYPPTSVDLPGTGATVLDRVAFSALGLTAVNDHDKSGDSVDDTLTAGLVGLDDNPAGPFAAVTFDCVEGAFPPQASAFSCVVSASDRFGQVVLENCSVSVTGP